MPEAGRRFKGIDYIHPMVSTRTLGFGDVKAWDCRRREGGPGRGCVMIPHRLLAVVLAVVETVVRLIL